MSWKPIPWKTIIQKPIVLKEHKLSHFLSKFTLLFVCLVVVLCLFVVQWTFNGGTKMFCKSNCVMFHQYLILRFCFYSPISRQDRRRRHCSSSLTWSSWFDRTELTETDLTEKVLDRNRVDRIHTWVYKKWQVSAGYEISTGSRVINPGRNNQSYLFQVWKAFSIQHIPSSKIVLKSKKFLSCLVSDD